MMPYGRPWPPLQLTGQADFCTPQVTENTALKQRVRQLSRNNKILEERLEAARSNNGFADRRIAQLEARLTEQAPQR
jgi:hypothetical protein